MSNIIAQKQCSECLEIKSTLEFYSSRNTKDRFMGRCKHCVSVTSRAYHEKNKEVVSVRKRLKRSADLSLAREKERLIAQRNSINGNSRKREFYKENKEVISGVRKKKYAHNELYREKSKSRTHAYYKEHRLERMEYSRSWKAANPEKVSTQRANRIAKVKLNGGVITPLEWKELCEKYGNKCLCCGRSDVRLELDHVIPIALGGPNVISNAQPLCRSCNSSKHTKTTDFR